MAKGIEKYVTEGTFLVNDNLNPIQFGELRIKNKAKKTNKYSNPKKGILVKNVMTGFCGTDLKLMEKGEREELITLPEGEKRLINGHEVIAYNPENKKYSVLLVRGGDAEDPTRFREDESIFEYGCSEDGGMCYESFYHPDMLLDIPKRAFEREGKLTERMAKRLIFSDPYACAIFHRERIEDIASAHNYRLFIREEDNKEKARLKAIKEIYKRVVIFGAGTTGFFMALELDRACKEYKIDSNIIAIGKRKDMPQVDYLKEHTIVRYIQNKDDNLGIHNLKGLSETIKKELSGNATLFVGSSGSSLESILAFNYGLLGNNAIYDNLSLGPNINFSTYPFAFKNQIIIGAVNYRKEHMEEAIRRLTDMPIEGLVRIYGPSEIKKDPIDFYKNEAYSKNKNTIKSAILWDESLLG